MIVIVKFTEPFAFEMPKTTPSVLRRSLCMQMIDELTIVCDEMPKLVHYPDGHARGYIDCGDGVVFAAKNVESVTVLP